MLVLLLMGVIITVGPAQSPWKERSSRHFVIYFKQVPEEFIFNVQEAAEQYYDDIIRDLGFSRYHLWSAQDKAKIYIFDDQDDFLKGGNFKNWSSGIALSSKKEIRTFPSAYGFFDSTLPHELGHIILQDFIGPNVTVPLWFEEGVAMYQEKGKRWGAHKIVKRSIEEKKFITLVDLFNVRLYNHTQRNFIELFYAESASIVYYMISDLGQHRFVKLCWRLREGEPFLQALTESYSRFRNIDDLNRCWINYLEGQ